MYVACLYCLPVEYLYKGIIPVFSYILQQTNAILYNLEDLGYKNFKGE